MKNLGLACFGAIMILGCQSGSAERVLELRITLDQPFRIGETLVLRHTLRNIGVQQLDVCPSREATIRVGASMQGTFVTHRGCESISTLQPGEETEWSITREAPNPCGHDTPPIECSGRFDLTSTVALRLGSGLFKRWVEVTSQGTPVVVGQTDD